MSDEGPITISLSFPYERAHAFILWAVTHPRQSHVQPIQCMDGVNLTEVEIDMKLRNGSMIWLRNGMEHKGVDECALFECLSAVGLAQPKMLADLILHSDNFDRHSLLAEFVVQAALAGEEE